MQLIRHSVKSSVYANLYSSALCNSLRDEIYHYMHTFDSFFLMHFTELSNHETEKEKREMTVKASKQSEVLTTTKWPSIRTKHE